MATITKEKAKQAIDKAVQEMKPLVESLEAMPATTKDHYGNYMRLLSDIPKERRKVFAMILIKAGANYNGVAWALRLLNGNY
jgi:hypothetical protein